LDYFYFLVNGANGIMAQNFKGSFVRIAAVGLEFEWGNFWHFSDGTLIPDLWKLSGGKLPY
jgi:hypothetical protein